MLFITQTRNNSQWSRKTDFGLKMKKKLFSVFPNDSARGGTGPPNLPLAAPVLAGNCGLDMFSYNFCILLLNFHYLTIYMMLFIDSSAIFEDFLNVIF